MARLTRSIRTADHDTTQRTGGVLRGTFIGVLESSEIVENSNQNGDVMKGTITVVEPEAQRGRKVFLNINVRHEGSAQAEKIGQEEFAKLAKAVGIPDEHEIEDTEELEGFEFPFECGPDKNDENRSKVYRYYYPGEEVPELGPKADTSNRGRTATRGRPDERGGSRGRDRDRERGREDSRGEGRGSREREEDDGRSRERGREDDRRGGREEESSREEGRGARDEGRGAGGRPWDRSRK